MIFNKNTLPGYAKKTMAFSHWTQRRAEVTMLGTQEHVHRTLGRGTAG
jgi:hypothetical protein